MFSGPRLQLRPHSGSGSGPSLWIVDMWWCSERLLLWFQFGFFFCYSALTQWYVRKWGPYSKAMNLFLGYVAKLLPLPICCEFDHR